MKILMVCLGNICRSPLAEGILQHKAKMAGLDWFIDSAGTGNYHIGEAPHVLSQKVALENGIDISGQKCRQFNKADFLVFDKIYVMDSSNYKDVRKMSGENWDEEKIDLLLNELYPLENQSVPDPWYGGIEDFRSVFKMIDAACNNIINRYTEDE
jgi:protein-tyrosine phosphatase